MPKKKKKTMAVHEMAELLGLKKTDSYWLIHKQKFQTITVNGKHGSSSKALKNGMLLKAATGHQKTVSETEKLKKLP